MRRERRGEQGPATAMRVLACHPSMSSRRGRSGRSSATPVACVTIGQAKEVVELVVNRATARPAATARQPRRAVPRAAAGRAPAGVCWSPAWCRSGRATPSSARPAAPGCGPAPRTWRAPRSCAASLSRDASSRTRSRSTPSRCRTTSCQRRLPRPARRNGRRRSRPETVGDRIDLSSSDVQDGRSWTGDVDDGGRRSIAAQVPVINNHGELVGITMVAEAYPSLARAGW